MKRIILAVLIVMVSASLSFAEMPKKYVFTLNAAHSGSTTIAKTGVSTMIVNGNSGVTVLPLDIPGGTEDGSYIVAMIDEIYPSQASVGIMSGTTGYNSGTTFHCSISCAMDVASISKQEKIPITIPGTAISSSVTPYMLTTQIPYGKYANVFFHTTGVTSFDRAKITVWVGARPGWRDPVPMLISEGSATLTSTTGTSTCTSSSLGAFPDGVEYMEMQVMSGGSVYYTTDGITTPSPSGSGTGFVALVYEKIALTKNKARNLKIACGVTTSIIRWKFLTRDPWK